MPITATNTGEIIYTNLSVVPETGPEVLDYATALEQILTPNPELLDMVRAALQSTVEDMSAILFDPAQKNAVMLYGGIMDWIICGKQGEQLPEGLVMDSDISSGMRVDDRIPFLNYSTAVLEEKLRESHFGKVLHVLRDDLTMRRSDILGTVHGFVRTSPEYQLIESFRQPAVPESERVPLDPYWKHIRTSQIEQDVRSRYSIAPEESLLFYPEEYREVKRQVFQLDEETRPRKIDHADNDPMERAYNYFFKRFNDQFQDHNVDVVSFEGGQALLMRPDGSEYTYYYTEGVIKNMVDTLQEEMGTKDTLFGMASNSFLEQAIINILTVRLSTLDGVIGNGFEALYHKADVYATAVTEFPQMLVQFPAQMKFLKALRQPQGEIFGPPGRTYNARYRTISSNEYWESAFDETAYIVSRDREKENEKIIKGFVGKYRTPDGQKTDMRLILNDSRSHKLADFTGEEDLVLSLTDKENRPQVPGFELKTVSKDGKWFGLVYDAEKDPYKKCEVPLSPEAVSKLAEEYQTIGLVSLAEELGNMATLTVDELKEIISQHSVYVSPPGNSKDGHRYLQIPSYPTSLSYIGNSGMVKGGRLHVQCTGAAQFLRLSLGMAFGKNSARSVNGLVLSPRSKKIDGIGHAQVAFTDGESTYILDSTPSENSVLSRSLNTGSFTLGLSGFSMPRLNMQRGPKAPKVPKELKVPKEPKSKKPQVEEPTIKLPQIKELEGEPVYTTINTYKPDAATELQFISTRTIEALKAALGKRSDDELYDYAIKKLRADDPARRVLELVVRAADQTVDVEYIQDTLQALETWATVDAETRSKHGIAPYSQGFLDMAHNTARAIIAIYPADKV